MMKTYTIKTETGTITITLDINNLDNAGPAIPVEELHQRLDNLDIDRDDKNMLWTKLRSKVVFIGGRIWEVGRKVLEIVIRTCEMFPHATSAAVAGLTLKLLLSSIPILGLFLGPVVGTIIAGLLFMAGLVLDLKDHLARALSSDTRKLSSVFNA